MRHANHVLLALACAVIPNALAAQDKGQFQKTTRESAAQLRAVGEPLDRCSLGGTIGQGAVVLRTTGSTSIKPGDKIISIDGSDEFSDSPEKVIASIRKMPPGSVLNVVVQRDGMQQNISLTCGNSRPTLEPMLKALDFASKGNFDECRDAVSQASYIDTGMAGLRAQCAAFIRNVDQNEVARLSIETLKMSIEDAQFAPSLRPAIVARLRNNEGFIVRSLGAAKYEELVAATKRWPGGETAFDSSAPDWSKFRLNAENALRGRLIDPDSARIEWPYGFILGTWKPFLSKKIDGYWTCGQINARNRMGGYTGSTAFVVVLDATGYVKYVELGQSRDFDLLSESCRKSAKLLPLAPPELTSTPAITGASGSQPSLADEIGKLVKLRDAGALSEAEFQAAKSKLLGNQP